MTRTERSTSPRAILKDRSESKSGYDKSLRKNGAGPHNWGSVRDEYNLERDALEDNDFDKEVLDSAEAPNAAVRPVVDGPSEDELQDKTSAAVSEDDVAKAREFRAKALKDGNVDLSAIARTSAGVSASPPKGSHVEVGRDATTRTLG